MTKNSNYQYHVNMYRYAFYESATFCVYKVSVCVYTELTFIPSSPVVILLPGLHRLPTFHWNKEYQPIQRTDELQWRGGHEPM